MKFRVMKLSLLQGYQEPSYPKCLLFETRFDRNSERSFDHTHKRVEVIDAEGQQQKARRVTADMQEERSN